MSNSTGTLAALSGDPLLVAVIGVAIGFVLGVLLSYGTFLGRRYLKALGKHKLLLMRTLRRELPSDHIASYDGDRLSVPRFEWGAWDPPSTKVLEHLRDPSYAPLSVAFATARERYSHHESAMETGRVKFEEQVNGAIGMPEGMVLWTGTYPGPKPWYALSTIRKILFEEHRQRLSGVYFDPVDIRYEMNPNPPSGALGLQLSLRRTQVAIGSQAQVAELEARIRPLLDDKSLRECVGRIDAGDKARISEPSKKRFNEERELILERLELKSEAVRGKCSLCPGFLRIHPVDETPA